MLVRRLSTIAAGAATIVVLTATAASAHFCYFSNPNPNGDAGRAGSNGFVSFGVIAASEGFCPAGAEILNDYRQGARLGGAVFNDEEVARTLTLRETHLRAMQFGQSIHKFT